VKEKDSFRNNEGSQSRSQKKGIRAVCFLEQIPCCWPAVIMSWLVVFKT
jgi:hypothetical protein